MGPHHNALLAVTCRLGPAPCVLACVRACVHACVRACARMCAQLGVSSGEAYLRDILALLGILVFGAAMAKKTDMGRWPENGSDVGCLAEQHLGDFLVLFEHGEMQRRGAVVVGHVGVEPQTKEVRRQVHMPDKPSSHGR